MSQKIVFAYRVKSDTGFAPCVDGAFLSLVCCKGGWKNGVQTGIRYWIGEGIKDGLRFDWRTDNVYLMGLYNSQLLYFARVTDVMPMEEYFKKYLDRKDCIYTVKKDGGWIDRKGVYSPHRGNEDRMNQDKYGVYALRSEKEHFIYLGEKSGDLGALPQKYTLPDSRTIPPITGKDADLLVTWFGDLTKKHGYGAIGKPHSSFGRPCEEKQNSKRDCGGC